MDVIQARALVNNLSPDPRIASILAYPHPLTEGGLVVICHDHAPDWLQLVGTVYRARPAGMSLFCLRHRELPQLSRPGIFAPPHQVNELPHLPYWLKHRGRVLAGQDLRPDVPWPGFDPALLLAGHIEGCRDSFRRYALLPALSAGRYRQLIALVTAEARHLMATALLWRGYWDVSLESVPSQFRLTFGADNAAWAAWLALSEAAADATGRPETDLAGPAMHCAWEWETLLHALEAHQEKVNYVAEPG